MLEQDHFVWLFFMMVLFYEVHPLGIKYLDTRLLAASSEDTLEEYIARPCCKGQDDPSSF